MKMRITAVMSVTSLQVILVYMTVGLGLYTDRPMVYA